MSKWRLPAPNRPFPPKNFLGIPQTYQDTSVSTRIEQNRGTENDMIVFTDDGINNVLTHRHRFDILVTEKSKFLSLNLTEYTSFFMRAWVRQIT